MKSVRVRFAPSPTGYLHIGNFRTALFNWLFARHHQGSFLVRIEDTDPERSKKEHIERIMDTLAWAGITPDEPIITQSDRLAEYKELVDQLLEQGKAYRCYCTQEAIKQRVGSDQFIKYDGLCRERTECMDGPFAIRFKLPDDLQEVTFTDLIRGPITMDRDQLDDFIIVRSDEWPTYNFVVVVDDTHMGITHVIRGEDHISNTPKQILLYQACGFPLPAFAHLPLILGSNGDRLSKRDAATAVLDYKEQGYVPDAFINYLARLGWAHGDQEIFSRDELIRYFTLDGVGKKGSIFDPEKLLWVNSVHIKNMTAAELLAYIAHELDPHFASACTAWNEEQLHDAVTLYKERVGTVCELINEVSTLYSGPQQYNQDDYAKWITPDTCAYLQAVRTHADHITVPALKDIAKQLQVKLVAVMQPLRLALIGKSSGPGVGELISLLGTQVVNDRIDALIKYIEKHQ